MSYRENALDEPRPAAPRRLSWFRRVFHSCDMKKAVVDHTARVLYQKDYAAWKRRWALRCPTCNRPERDGFTDPEPDCTIGVAIFCSICGGMWRASDCSVKDSLNLYSAKVRAGAMYDRRNRLEDL
jgi:hypothetical protein